MKKAMRQLMESSDHEAVVLDPESIDPKTNLPIRDVLIAKHPAPRIPDLEHDSAHSAFETYETTPDAVPLRFSARSIEEAASKLNGSGGPSGIDAKMLQNWLICFGNESLALRQELAAWTEWLANGDPPYAAIRALMHCREVALNKKPGVRPIGIGEIFRRLIAQAIIRASGTYGTVNASNYNLCVGLQSGIEEAIQAVQQYLHSPPRTQTDSSTDSASSTDSYSVLSAQYRGVGYQSPSISSSDSDEDSILDSSDSLLDPDAVVLIDARNGFNELNRFAMLWTVCHLWPAGARFAFHCYRHTPILFLRRGAGKQCVKLHSREGITQGDSLSMLLYGLTLVPLAKIIREATDQVIQPWYAGDMAMAGPASKIKIAMNLLMKYGPDRGYFPEPDKSVLVCIDELKRKACSQVLGDYEFKGPPYARYLGGFIGDRAYLGDWLRPKILAWESKLHVFSMVAKTEPQAAYSAFTISLQNDWLTSNG